MNISDAAVASNRGSAISAATLRKVERAAGGLATRSIALMDERLPWFRTLPAVHRSWVTLVAQAGISGYVGWVNGGLDGFKLTEAVFGSAPRALAKSVTLRRTVELVRIAISVAEEHLPALATDAVEKSALADSLLRYSREVAFSAAGVYAAAAESRGAWDQRLEALVVDSIVRGDGGDSLASRAAALSWDFSGYVVVLVGSPPATEQTSAALGVAALAGLHGENYILIVSAPTEQVLLRGIETLLDGFGLGAVVQGPIGTGLSGAMTSARQALSGMRAVQAWPAAPRGVSAQELLPERTLAGDQDAREYLLHNVFAPLMTAGEPLLRTLGSYLETGRALESAAREQFVHANTIRYRLRRITDVTGLDPTVSRDALTLHVAMIIGRLSGPA